MAQLIKIVRKVVYLCPHCNNEVLLPDATDRSKYSPKTHKRWTDEETFKLEQLRSEKLSWKEVARRLSRTVPSCTDKYYRITAKH